MKTKHGSFYRWWRRLTKFKYIVPIKYRYDETWFGALSDGACRDPDLDLQRLFMKWSDK